jgi:hypothetical protein
MEYRYHINQFQWNPSQRTLYGEAHQLYFQTPDGRIHPEGFPNQKQQFYIDNPETGGFRRFRFKKETEDWAFESEDRIKCIIVINR